MNKVRNTQRDTGSRWIWGPALILFAGLILPIGGCIVAAFFTGYLAYRGAPRRDIVTMGLTAVILGVIVWGGVTGRLDAYHDLTTLGPND